MTVFSSHDVRACLRQCVTCFGHGKILYIGAHAADALDFLLAAGTDMLSATNHQFHRRDYKFMDIDRGLAIA